jgi:hypothetical protein
LLPFGWAARLAARVFDPAAGCVAFQEFVVVPPEDCA